jgi:high-affinity iron transporter
MLSFLSVFREGLELVVFNLTQVNQSSYSVAISSIGGLIVAIGLAFLIFKASVRLNLSIIFKVLGFILIFLGGELFAEGLVKIFPNGGEALDIGALSVFIIASLYIFLKNDIQRILLKNTKA